MPPFQTPYVRDTAPAQSCAAMSSGVATTPGRAFVITITAAATVTFTFADSTNTGALNFPNTGIFEFNWAITTFTTNSGTVGNCVNLY